VTDVTVAIWAKSAVGLVAIVAIAALAIAHVVSGADAIGFARWTIGVWMGAVAVSSGAGAIAKAMTQKTSGDATAATNAETIQRLLPHAIQRANKGDG
jgi:hypothetical protein